MKENELLKNKIKSIEVGEIKYFSIKEIKAKYGQVKFDTVNSIKEEEDYFVRSVDVEELTEFDKNIKTVLNFKNKK